MGYSACRWARLACWNLWPAARLLLVLAALGVWAHRSLALNLPPPRWCGEVSCYIGIIFVVCTVFSQSLARLFLVSLCSPLYAAVVLNGVFYDGPRLMLRQFVGPRSPCLEAGLALASEIVLFMSLTRSIALLFKAYCHF